MSVQELITWLGNCPVLQGDKLNWSYLPSYSGWSLTIPKAETRTDILGNTRERWQLHDYGSRALQHYEVVSKVSSRYYQYGN